MLVPEQFPAAPSSPRNACLGAVRAARLLVLIVTRRGGFVTPSGMTATEEEFHEALRLGKPVLAFVEDGDKDVDGARLEAKVCNYVSGLYRRRFRDASELGREVLAAVQNLLPSLTNDMRDGGEVIRTAIEGGTDEREPRLRTVVAPARIDELCEPQALGTVTMLAEVNSLLHGPEAGLFDYSYASPHQVGLDWVELTQVRHRGQWDEIIARVRITATGLILIEAIPPQWVFDDNTS